MKRKNFIYLVQGESALVTDFFTLRDREHSDAIILTYDKETEDCIYYPNSTWAEGRNFLLEKALEKGEYLYYIFCDDDIAFIKGGFEEFENMLLKYRPAIGIPIVTLLLKTRISILKSKAQMFFVNDEPLMAFHKDVVNQKIVVPYQTRFDHLSWWGACLIQQILIQTFYKYSNLQFNNIIVDNTEHARYEVTGYGARIYSNVVRRWLLGQLNGRYKDVSRRKSGIIILLLSAITLFKCKVKNSWMLSEKVIKSKFSEYSVWADKFN